MSPENLASAATRRLADKRAGPAPDAIPGAPGMSDVMAAAARIRGLADATPLVPAALSDRLGVELLLKLELCQPTGAFKLRGAVNAVAQVEGPGVVCCSTGNHGRAVAFAARQRGLRAVVCLSELVPQAKVEGIRAQGAEVHLAGRSQDEAQVEATRLAEAEGLIEIPPFDNAHVIAGQGTIGLELLSARPDLEALIIPLSGGGLAAGIALAAKAIKPGIRIIGVSMDRGAAMAEALAAGHPVYVTEVASLADSLGGGIGLQNALSYPLCAALLDEVVLVSEAEIYRAMQAVFHAERLVAEGGSVVGIAALLAGKLKLTGPAATVLTGRNVDMAQFKRVINGEPVTLGALELEGQHHEP
ncbi:threonine dehydratase [Pseudooceanicola antarcticus]|uniref:Threonine dehydratase n=2 Tax=Pseudooceanicola antarcticus TaxID=1247613 RepID=A0A285IXP7_9RHOB|nr:threonine dehydratase [Pseudooceanicola antarcticus]